MNRVQFTFSGGRQVQTTEAQAKLLKRMGRGDYLTRDMADQPNFVKDGLDDMDKAQLHALAKERGIKIHHNAGADKVREALRS